MRDAGRQADIVQALRTDTTKHRAGGMGDRNEEVFAEIRAELDRRPGLPPGVLYQLAVHIDPSVATLQPRQFNLLYVQPARRELTRDSVGRSGGQSGRKRLRAARPPRPAPPAAGAERSAESSARPTARAGAARRAPIAATRPAPDPVAGRTRPTSGEPQAGPASPAPSPPRAPHLAPERVREALLAFVHDIAAAERRADLVRVLSQVDDYIDGIGVPA